MIYFDHVTKIFPPNCTAIDNVSFGVSESEFLTIVGRSGAGKTTLLKLLLKEEKPTSGRIFFEGVDITRLPRSQLPYHRRKIGVIYQDYKLLPQKTVFENVAFTLEILGKSAKEIEAVVPQALELVGIQDKINNFPLQLSGGEKQRVAIARAIVSQPKVLLADEPTGNLDPYNTQEIISLLLKIHQLGTAVILCTHQKDVVEMVKSRVIVLDRGRLMRDDPQGRYYL